MNKTNATKMRFAIIALVLITSLLTGCMGNGTADSGNKENSGKKALVVYSNSASDGRGDWLKEKAAEQGFAIEIVEGGGGEIVNRLVAEKNNPIADVVFGLNTVDYENFKAESLLEQYKPVWASEVSDGLNDPDGYYHALVKQAIFLIYNSEMYDENTAPKDWTDLWNNAQFHNKYAAPSSFGGGTTRAVLAGILVRYQDPNGTYGISEAGWNEVKSYLQYGFYAAEGEDFYANLASGKSPLGPMWSSGIAEREKQYGVKAGIVRPEIGVPYVVEQVGIIKGTKNLETAQQFIDWFGSAEVQGEWSKTFSSMPANAKALEQASQEIKDMEASLKPQDIDWSFVAQNINQWVEKIELELVP